MSLLQRISSFHGARFADMLYLSHIHHADPNLDIVVRANHEFTVNNAVHAPTCGRVVTVDGSRIGSEPAVNRSR
jgi:hypothetical protein